MECPEVQPAVCSGIRASLPFRRTGGPAVRAECPCVCIHVVPLPLLTLDLTVQFGDPSRMKSPDSILVVGVVPYRPHTADRRPGRERRLGGCLRRGLGRCRLKDELHKYLSLDRPVQRDQEAVLAAGRGDDLRVPDVWRRVQIGEKLESCRGVERYCTHLGVEGRHYDQPVVPLDKVLGDIVAGFSCTCGYLLRYLLQQDVSSDTG